MSQRLSNGGGGASYAAMVTKSGSTFPKFIPPPHLPYVPTLSFGSSPSSGNAGVFQPQNYQKTPILERSWSGNSGRTIRVSSSSGSNASSPKFHVHVTGSATGVPVTSSSSYDVIKRCSSSSEVELAQLNGLDYSSDLLEASYR